VTMLPDPLDRPLFKPLPFLGSSDFLPFLAGKSIRESGVILGGPGHFSSIVRARLGFKKLAWRI
jgi:hypothetical protein